ncbi:MAG: hypothetical protein AABX73_02015 [Nanoarchaeota archaeon]
MKFKTIIFLAFLLLAFILGYVFRDFFEASEIDDSSIESELLNRSYTGASNYSIINGVRVDLGCLIDADCYFYDVKIANAENHAL